MTFVLPKAKHNFRSTRCCLQCAGEMSKISSNHFAKVCGVRGMGIWQLISRATPPPVTNISLSLADRRIENCDQNKHSRENTIESSDISFHIHACIHTMKIENGKLFARKGEGRKGNEENGFRSYIVFHPADNTSQHQAAKRKKYFKIISAIWFDDVSPANHLMIIYCRCR